MPTAASNSSCTTTHHSPRVPCHQEKRCVVTVDAPPTGADGSDAVQRPAYRRLRHLGNRRQSERWGPGNHTRHRSTRREGRDFFHKEVLARGHACSQRHADAHQVQSHLYTRQGGEHL